MAIISAGGHVYDYKTGTWAGETQGSFGDGKKWGASPEDTKVWYDANGISGLQDLNPRGVATPQINAGGAGPSAGAVVSGGDGKITSGPAATVVATGPLKPKLKKTSTQIMIGGGLVPHDQFWSDAEEAEGRWGESEFLSPTWFYSWGVAGADAVKAGQLAAGEIIKSAPGWKGGLPSEVVEPDPIYMDGWVSYDESQTWEKAPKGSPADQYWSF